MPGRNGTGPEGRGPMTGWGLGFCASPGERETRPGFGYGRGYMGGYGSGYGEGYGRGYSRGPGRGIRCRRYWDAPLPDPERERIVLAARARNIEDELKAIKERLDSLPQEQAEGEKKG